MLAPKSLQKQKMMELQWLIGKALSYLLKLVRFHISLPDSLACSQEKRWLSTCRKRFLNPVRGVCFCKEHVM